MTAVFDLLIVVSALLVTVGVGLVAGVGPAMVVGGAITGTIVLRVAGNVDR
jgi:hypothetical protein